LDSSSYWELRYLTIPVPVAVWLLKAACRTS
jgi:hypothetical protein